MHENLLFKMVFGGTIIEERLILWAELGEVMQNVKRSFKLCYSSNNTPLIPDSHYSWDPGASISAHVTIVTSPKFSQFLPYSPRIRITPHSSQGDPTGT